MKKILTLFMMAFVPLSSTIAVKTPIKNTFISKKNIYQDRRPNPWERQNSATLRRVGAFNNQPKKPEVGQPSIRLTISMKGDDYNTFLARIIASPSLAAKEYFIMMFTGDQEPYFTSDWKIVVQELKNESIKQAQYQHLDDNYFYDLFVDWLKSDNGWANFKAVFTGANLSNNTYDMPVGYNQEEAEKEFRMNGAILQFDFNLVEGEQKTWKIDNRCRIFPYIDQILGLTCYFQDNSYVSGSEQKIPPVIGLYVKPLPSPPSDTLLKLKKDVLKSLGFYFHIPTWVWTKKLIKITGQQDNIHIHYVFNPTPISISFFSLNGSLYTTKIVNLFLAAY